jgi:hypothetical protein
MPFPKLTDFCVKITLHSHSKAVPSTRNRLALVTAIYSVRKPHLSKWG